MRTGRGRGRGVTGEMVEIKICPDLAPSGSPAAPQGDDSASEEKSPPKDWSHRLWPSPTGATDTRRGGPWSHAQSHPSAQRLTHPPSLYTPARAEDPELAE